MSHNMTGGMGLLSLLFWLLILIGVIFIFKSMLGRNGNETAQDILDKRYAKGEIDEETYRKMKTELTKKE